MSISQEPLLYEPKLYIFNPPADPNIPGSEVGNEESLCIIRNTVEYKKHVTITMGYNSVPQ